MAKICQKWTIFIKKTVKFDKNQQKINGFDQKNWRKINDLKSTITETGMESTITETGMKSTITETGMESTITETGTNN